jgi:hypothetical protein
MQSLTMTRSSTTPPLGVSGISRGSPQRNYIPKARHAADTRDTCIPSLRGETGVWSRAPIPVSRGTAGCRRRRRGARDGLGAGADEVGWRDITVRAKLREVHCAQHILSITSLATASFHTATQMVRMNESSSESVQNPVVLIFFPRTKATEKMEFARCMLNGFAFESRYYHTSKVNTSINQVASKVKTISRSRDDVAHLNI